MRDLVKSIEYKNHKINIFWDTDPESPREWYTADTMAIYHSRYSFGDAKQFNDPQDLKEWIEAQGDQVYWLPVYMYDHSGVTISTKPFGCHWDSGQVGYIYMTAETAIKEGIIDPLAFMQNSVDNMDQWLRGDIYGYIVESDESDNLDSCWGFYGLDYCETEAKAIVDYYDSKIPKQLDLFAA